MKKFIKLILTIGVTFAYIFGAAAFMENFYMFLYGRNAVFYTSNNFFAVQILAFLIFLAAMAYFWSRDGLESLDCGSDKGIKSRKKNGSKGNLDWNCCYNSVDGKFNFCTLLS